MTGTALVETAFAKINLALHVRGREADGYHRLETLFAFARDGDGLTARPSDGLTLSVSGPFGSGLGAGDDNLVLRAARAVRAHFGVREGAALALDKRLPVASGIGGGSADAAAAMRLLARLWRLDIADPAFATIAAGLGADVPACLLSRTVRGEGRGDRLLPEQSAGLTGMPLLLVNPGVAVPTGPVFQGWDGIDRGPLPAGKPLDVARAGRNDLESPARRIAPLIGAVLDSLRSMPGAQLVRMSGSGATCFALFANGTDSTVAAETIRQSRPSWWCLETGLR